MTTIADKTRSSFNQTSSALTIMPIFAGMVTCASALASADSLEYRSHKIQPGSIGNKFNRKYNHFDRSTSSSDLKDLESIANFANTLQQNSESLSGDFRKVFEENVWDLI